MLSSDPKLRGHLINLKKMLLPSINDQFKKMTTKLLQMNVLVMYGGIDSVNMHFSNKPIHSPFIELVLIKSDFEKPSDFALARSELTRMLVSNMNETLISLAGNSTCIITREILRECGSEGGHEGSYFVVHEDHENRHTIDFYHDVTKKLSFQPFVEIRSLPNLQVTVLDKYGIFYMPLGYTRLEIKKEVGGSGGPDWTFRDSTLKQCMERSGLTFASWTFNNLLKLCYPSIAMRRMKTVEAVKKLIEKTVLTSPVQNTSMVKKLEEVLLSELHKWDNNEILKEVLNLEVFYKRCALLGLIPDDRDFEENLCNEYNRTHISEIRTTSKIK
jgi:hypothetical protein